MVVFQVSVCASSSSVLLGLRFLLLSFWTLYPMFCVGLLLFSVYSGSVCLSFTSCFTLTVSRQCTSYCVWSFPVSLLLLVSAVSPVLFVVSFLCIYVTVSLSSVSCHPWFCGILHVFPEWSAN